MFTATKQRSTIGERPAETPASAAARADAAATSGGHPASRPAYRAKAEFRTPPAHLLLLRDALADRADRNQGQEPGAGGRAEHRGVASGRRARTQSAAQLTLSQWVSRTARIGTTADDHTAG
ncbi:hypothetical protein [Streptomyces sp. NPDC052042]|uniref:hypothetical protein n=1 Tax=Streptomyces sp. NPDC052042 TaxID=3365683 RepID=UPI0037CE6A52